MSRPVSNVQRQKRNVIKIIHALVVYGKAFPVFLDHHELESQLAERRHLLEHLASSLRL